MTLPTPTIEDPAADGGALASPSVAVRAGTCSSSRSSRTSRSCSPTRLDRRGHQGLPLPRPRPAAPERALPVEPQRRDGHGHPPEHRLPVPDGAVVLVSSTSSACPPGSPSGSGWARCCSRPATGVRYLARLLGISAGASSPRAHLHAHAVPHRLPREDLGDPHAVGGPRVARRLHRARGPPRRLALPRAVRPRRRAHRRRQRHDRAPRRPRPVLWLVLRRGSRRRRRGAVVGATPKAGVLSVVVSLWWVAGLWAEGAYGINVLRYTETFPTVTLTSLSSEVFSGASATGTSTATTRSSPGPSRRRATCRTPSACSSASRSRPSPAWRRPRPLAVPRLLRAPRRRGHRPRRRGQPVRRPFLPRAGTERLHDRHHVAWRYGARTDRAPARPARAGGADRGGRVRPLAPRPRRRRRHGGARHRPRRGQRRSAPHRRGGGAEVLGPVAGPGLHATGRQLLGRRGQRHPRPDRAWRCTSPPTTSAPPPTRCGRGS